MNIGAPRVWTLVIATCLSGFLHFWIARVTVWEVLNSALQFVVWPGLFAASMTQAILPESITVHKDPLPHSFAMGAGLVFNVVAWAAIFFGIGVAIGRVMQGRKRGRDGI